MAEKTRLTSEELLENFADLHPPLAQDEAVAEASRCLYCYDAPCTRACPTHIDVPRFIRQIMHADVGGAAETILSENVFGGSCARACPTEVLCEGACVDRTLLRAPVQIGRLQRYATDFAAEKELWFFEPAEDSGRRVAVIGSGPAGMSCAHELRKFGHAVTVFEAGSVPGGLNTLGIAAYKISTEFALSEVQRIIGMGVEMRYDSRVDRETLAGIRREYDAVFVGIGLGETAGLGVPGEDVSGVWEALDFVFQSHTGPLEHCEVGREVVVIGAGNTAIDVATQAVRLGADHVTIAYRRTESDMSAFAYEYDLAKSDRVRFLWQVQPVAFSSRDGKLCGVRLERVRQVGSGRSARVERIPDSEFEHPCDMAIKALGQIPVVDVLGDTAGIRIVDGCVAADPATGFTGAEGVFAGGDCTSRGAEIVDAVQEGKVAARGIHDHVSGIAR